jgi:ERCC4-related helicase
VMSDINRGVIALADVACVVIDEAHKATGE